MSSILTRNAQVCDAASAVLDPAYILNEGNHNRQVSDALDFERRQARSNIAIPFLNQTSGSANIVRNMRREVSSSLVARHTAGAQDCDYAIAWTNTYLVGIDCTATAKHCGPR